MTRWPAPAIALGLALAVVNTLAAPPARAQAAGDELARALIAGRATRPTYRSLPAPELEDWIDPETGTSTRTATGCGGLLVEAALAGDRARNYVVLTILNATPEPMLLTRLTASARFGDGAYRKLLEAQPITLEPGSTLGGGYPLDDKRVFEGQRSVELAIRVLTPTTPNGCTIALRFERYAGDQAAASYTSYDSLELSFGLGMRAAESGGQSELQGGSRVAAQLDFNGFLSMHHGLSATLLIDLFGSGAVDDITTRQVGPDPGVGTTGFLVGYTGRIHLAPWLTAAYNASTGPYVFMVSDKSDDGTQLSTAVFALRQRVRLAARVVAFGGGFLAVAASLGHLVIPYGELGAIELSGQTVTPMLELMITD